MIRNSLLAAIPQNDEEFEVVGLMQEIIGLTMQREKASLKERNTLNNIISAKKKKYYELIGNGDDID